MSKGSTGFGAELDEPVVGKRGCVGAVVVLVARVVVAMKGDTSSVWKPSVMVLRFDSGTISSDGSSID